jgi:cytochrome b involved in lipid metabolism
LLDEGAKDATTAFDDVGHSDDARDLLKKYYVGDVDPAVSIHLSTRVMPLCGLLTFNL